MIRVFQCKADCCTVQVPSKRFWYIRTPTVTETVTSFRAAVAMADELRRTLPQEVTA